MYFSIMSVSVKILFLGSTNNTWLPLDQDWYGVYSWNPYSTPDECDDSGKLWQYPNQDPSNDDYKLRCASGSGGYKEGACYVDDGTFTTLEEDRCINNASGLEVTGVDEECCSDLSAFWRECSADRNTCVSEDNGCGGLWVQISQASGDPNVNGYWDPDCPACNLPSDVPVTSCSNIDQSDSDLEDCMAVCDDVEGRWIGDSDLGTEKNQQYDKGEVFVDSPEMTFTGTYASLGSGFEGAWLVSAGLDQVLAASLAGEPIDTQESPSLLIEGLVINYVPGDIDSENIFIYSDDICKAPGQTGAGNCLSELVFSDVYGDRLSTYFEPVTLDVSSSTLSASVCGDGICSPKLGCFDGDDVQTGYRNFSECILAGYAWEYYENVDTCPDDCESFCGDMHCDSVAGEDYGTCGADCLPGCGDGVCSLDVMTENGVENAQNCPSDCSDSFCGDHYCDSGEDQDNCSTDCYSICGDGLCDSGENSENCSADCIAGCSLSGDVNDDGIVDILDIVITINTVIYGDSAECSGDINNDGIVYILDIVIIINIIVG